MGAGHFMNLPCASRHILAEAPDVAEARNAIESIAVRKRDISRSSKNKVSEAGVLQVRPRTLKSRRKEYPLTRYGEAVSSWPGLLSLL
jgi:hypothetical protein